MRDTPTVPYSFCHYCGGSLTGAIETADGPQCAHCGNVTWMNVISVAGLVVPVDPCLANGKKHGVWVMRRGEEPFAGQLALPAGFRIFNKRPYQQRPIEEVWQQTGCREAREEINVICDADYVEHLLTESAHDDRHTGNRDLIIGQANRIIHVGPFEPNKETLERVVIYPGEEEQLCFSIHRRAVQMYWNKYYR